MTFAELFAEAEEPEIEVDGRRLSQVFRDDLTCARLRIDRIRATTSRRQGLVLDADVDLIVDGRGAPRLVLWSDSAPETVDIEVDGPTEIRVWNVWSDHGMTQAWVGWASIHVETDDEVTRLTCTDGHTHSADEPADLVVELTRVDA